MATQAQQSQLLAFLVGAFDAAPTVEIFAELTAAIDAGVSVDGLSDIIVGSDVFKGLYADDAAFVANFPTALVGDFVSAEVLADAEGVVAQWINEDGMSIAAVISNALIALAGVDSADETWGAAKVALENKVTVAQYYVDNVSGATLDLATLQGVLAGVTQDAATVTTAQASIDATANAGETFTLTTGSETVTGTAMNDTINGVASALSSARTLDVTDTIDGGEGSDTLNVDLQSNFTGFTTGSLANVEVVSLSNDTTVTRTFTGTGVSGVEEYQLTGAVNLAGQTEIATVTAGARTADLSLTYASKVTDGTADSLALNVTDFGTEDDASTTANEEVAVGVTVAGIETLNLSAEGTNVVALANAASKDVTIEGSGSVKVNNVNGATKTIDGSASTGALDLTVTNATAMTSITTGSGDDKVSIIAGNQVAANATLSGGEGSDTLVVTSAGATTQFSQSGFETIEFGAQTGTVTMSLKNTTDVEEIVAKNLGSNVTVAGASSDLSYSLSGAVATGALLTSDSAGSAAVAVEDASTTTTTTTNDTDLTLTKAASVELSVAEKMIYTGALTASEASSVELAIAGQTTGATVSAAKATSVAITSVAGVSSLTLTAAKATDLNVNNAKDLNLTGSTLTGLESLTVTGAGDFNATGVALSSLNQASISSTGAVTLGNVGSATQDYSATINSTGSESFTVGTITTQNQAVAVDVVDSLGAVAVGNIAAGTGSVDVTVSTAGTTSVGTINAKDVSVDLSGALSTVTVNNAITATGNVTFVGSELQANTGVDIDLTGTGAQTVSLTGGIQNDTFDIDSTAGNVTVTGNLDLGTDTLTVDGTGNIDLSGLTGYATATLTTTGTGNNTVVGGSGNDTITAGTGADTLTGGAGTDTFVFADGDTLLASHTTITDFSYADDTIQLGTNTGASLVTLTAALAGNAVANTVYVTRGDFANDGTFTISATGADVQVLFETDGAGDSAPEEEIALIGVGSDIANLTAADFT